MSVGGRCLNERAILRVAFAISGNETVGTSSAPLKHPELMAATKRIEKVCILGLDAAAYPLVNRWIDEGQLPAIARMKREGSFGLLKSLPVPNSAAAWTSIVTGVNPGRHGIIDFYVPTPGTYDIQFLCGKDRKSPAFWQRSPRFNYVIVNVPMTYPADAVNGAMISGLDAPGVDSKGFCHPPELLTEIQKSVGPYILHPGIIGHFIAGQIDEGLQSLTDALQRRLDTVLHLMRTCPWDCFMVVFSTLDLAQHCFWKYFDPSHPQYDSAEAKRYGHVLLDLYRRMDDIVGQILSEVTDDCLVLLLSDHGAGPKHSATHQLNDWLHSQGLLHFRSSGKGQPVKRLLKKTYSLMERSLTRRGKDLMVKLLPGVRDRVRSRMAYADIDWERTQVYADNIAPSLRVNLRGREPCGIVEPGEAYEKLLREITVALRQLTSLNGDGQPLVAEIRPSRDLYSGPYAGTAPDLFIRWNDAMTVSAISPDLPPPAPPTGEFQVISGDHHPDGILALWGPGVKSGAEISATLYDIAPTVLAALGGGGLQDMDGRVLEEAFDEPLEIVAGAANSHVETATTTSETDLTDDDTETLRNRLRGLGYVE